jgi:hypothetical protein
VVTIIDLLQQIKEKRSTLSVLTQKVSDLQTAGGLLQQNQNYVPDINIAVPDAPNPDMLSQQVMGLAAKDSVEILSFSVNQIVLMGTKVTNSGSSEFKPLPGNAKEMPFSLSVRGSFSGLAGFINDFENLRASKTIDTLGINSSTTDKGLVIVTVISGRTPFLGS